MLTRPVPGSIRPPDSGASQGGDYGANRTGSSGNSHPHTGVDYLNPAGAPVVAPEGGYVEPSGSQGALICMNAGTLKCDNCEKEFKKQVCWRLVHINPTAPTGPIAEGAQVGTTIPSSGAPHAHVEYYVTTCPDGKLRRQNPEPIFTGGGL